MANSTTNLDLISSSQASKEITANALFDAESPASLYGRRASATANLTWGYYGGMLAIAGTPTAIANGTKTLTNGATNYVEADPTTGNVVVNTSNFTAANIPLYAVVTAGNLVTSYTDYRALAFGKTVLASPLGNATFAGIVTWTAAGTQAVISQDASIFREGQQSTMNSGTAYSTNGNLPIMKIWMHNTGINPSTGNFTAADATDYCTALIYSEDDKLKGFSSAAAVTAGNTPTISNTWYLDIITGQFVSFGASSNSAAAAGSINIRGGQIGFPATQIPSTDPNTLDDYEEGTFTPAFALSVPGTSSFGTYSTQQGSYTKIGREVTCYFRMLSGTFTLGTGSGNLLITGLPFVASSAIYEVYGTIGLTSGFISTQPFSSSLTNGTTQLFLLSSPPSTALNSASCASNMLIGGTITYIV